MTLIAKTKDFPSKKVLAERLNAGAWLSEPSITGSWLKRATELPVGFTAVVTNGAQRTKFAKIEKRADGWKVS